MHRSSFRGLVAFLLLPALALAQAPSERQWESGEASGSWSANGSWVGNSTAIPNSQSERANFSRDAATTITQNAAYTLFGLKFGSTATGAHTFDGTSTLTLQPNSGYYGIEHLANATHTFNAPLTLGNSQEWHVNSTSGGLAFNNTIGLGANTLTLNAVNAGNAISIGGTMSGTGGLTKTGAGSLTISVSLAYTGATTITGGTLSASSLANGGSSSSIGASTGVAANLVLDGGTLAFTGASATTNRLFTLGANGGTLDAGSGTLTFNNAGSMGVTGTGTRTLTLTGTNTTASVLSAAIGDQAGNATSILKTGTGTWTLAGNNAYTGTTTVSAGLLGATGSNNALGTGAASLLLNGGSLYIYNNTSLDLGRNTTVSANAAIYSDNAFGTGGAGVTHSLGTLAIGGQTLAVDRGFFTTTGTAGVTFGATTLSGDATFDIGTGAQLTLGAINDGGGEHAFIKNDVGSLVLTGVNTHTGGVLLTAGDLTVNSGASLTASTAPLVIWGGTLNLNNAAQTVGHLSGSTGAIAFGAGHQFTVDSVDTSVFSGTFTGDATTGFVKSGSGALALAGDSTGFSGSATVSQGTLVLQHANALGTSSSAITLNDASTGANANGLLIGTSGVTVSRDIGVANAGTGTTTLGGSITSGNGVFSGAVTLAKAATLTADGSSTITFTGPISGSGNITKTGAATVTLSGNNSGYTGTTRIDAGALGVTGSNNALGSGAAAVVLNGGSLYAYNDTALNLARNTTVGASSSIYSDNGGGTGGAGVTHTLGNLSIGAQTLSVERGFLTSSGTAGITFADTTLTGNATFDVANGAQLTLGAVGESGGSWSLTKADAGALVFSGVNTYTGGTILTGGNLTVNSGASLAASTGNLTVNAGMLNLNNAAQTVGALSGSGGTIALSSGHDFTTSSSSTTTFAGAFSGDSTTSLAKAGSGSLTLSGDNSAFTGTVAVDAGTLVLQHANALGSGTGHSITGIGTAVTSGATLQLSGGVTVNNNGLLSVAGTGVGGAGAIVGSNGSNGFAGSISLAGDTTIKTASTNYDYLALGTYPGILDRPPDDPSTLSLGSHTLTLGGGDGTGTIYLNSKITGTGGLTVDMNNASDSVYLTAHENTYTGTTLIKQGTLLPYTLPNTYPGDSSALENGTDQYYGIAGPITVGDGVGTAGSAQLKIASDPSRTTELIDFRVPVTMNRDGLFTVGEAQSIGAYSSTINPDNLSLIFNGGKVEIVDTGVLYLAGNVKVNAVAGETAVIDGVGKTLSLTIHQGASPVPNANRVFDVTGGVGNTSDLTINATIKNGSFTKNGAGTMTVTGNNTAGYEGTTTVNNGILAITNNGALGQGLNGASSGTYVNGGASGTRGTLQLQGGITVSSENLYLNGTGFQSRGALENLSGNNTWASAIDLQTDARITSTDGLLTISGTVSSSTDSTLDVYGAGNTTLSGAVANGNGGINKYDSGKLILGGPTANSNTYGGDTHVYAGILSAQKNSALGEGNGGASTTVHSGAALELDSSTNGNLTLTEPNLYLNGTGISDGGALRNVRGDNKISGLVTISSPSRINADHYSGSATTLTLSGGLASANQALTIGGTGNVTVTGAIANGTGSLTKDGTGTFTFQRIDSGTTIGTVGQTHIAGGTMQVGNGTASHVTKLTTAELTSAVSTTLIIGSGSTVTSVFDNGAVSDFYGILGPTSGGTLSLTSTAGSASGLAFKTSFDAPSLTLEVGGATKGSTNLNDYFRLDLASVDISVGTLRITGDTILDFNNSANTFLSSTTLEIAAGAKVTVEGWASLTTVWYANTTIIGIGSQPGVGTQYGTGQLADITFSNHNGYNYDGLTTTWVNGTPNGWLDREIRPTPEPATYGALFLSGCVGLLGWRRFRQRRR